MPEPQAAEPLPPSTLQVDVRKQMGILAVQVAFTVRSGWTALFGPSGTGKSTVLRLIAGLDRPDAGRILCTSPSHTCGLQGQAHSGRAQDPLRETPSPVLFDSQAGIDVPAEQRVLRLVSQRPALFPHMTVESNVLYRSPARGRDAGESAELRQAVDGVFSLCRVEHLRRKLPGALSGGERQRVALARALAPGRGCRALLLDEPFTGMDPGLKESLLEDLLPYLAQRRVPVLLVTHDVAEVFRIGAEVVRLERGRITAIGPAEKALADERQRLGRALGLI